MELMSLLLNFGIQNNVIGVWVIIQLKLFLCSQAEHLYDHHYERVQAEYQHIVALVILQSWKVMVKMIQLLYVHVCCICCVVFLDVFQCYITSISLSAAYFSDVCLADFWSDSKQEIVSLSWATRADSLPCDFPVFILKLSECKKVELSAALLASFDNYLVSINDTALLSFQLNFMVIITTS